MRFINTNTGILEEFHGRGMPRYAILSHTWDPPGEITYQEYMQGGFKHKKGYEKIYKACELARDNGMSYVWVDTCCIDKSSSAELSEAINSMYQWYQQSHVCYAFLLDLLPKAKLDEDFGKCRWFTRGWTLQELIAPREVLFYDATYTMRGSKESLGYELSKITKIDHRLLIQQRNLSDFSVAQKMSWAAHRETTRVEDEAYCLLGIFGIHMPLLYGEAEKAFRRLQEEIIRYTADLSIFAWEVSSAKSPLISDGRDIEVGTMEYFRSIKPRDRLLCGVLATSPAEFSSCHTYVTSEADPRELSISTFGFKIRQRVVLRPLDDGDPNIFHYVIPLNCCCDGLDVGILVRPMGRGRFLRENPMFVVKGDFELGFGSLRDLHLLTQMPKQTLCEQSRCGLMERILPRMRSSLVQFSSDQEVKIWEPWPEAQYDFEDRAFFLSGETGYDYGTLKLFVDVPESLRKKSQGGFSQDWRFFAANWAAGNAYAQFGFIEEDSHGALLDKLQLRAVERDLRVKMLLQDLRRNHVPKLDKIILHPKGTDLSVVLSCNVLAHRDPNLATGNSWKVNFTFRVCERKTAQRLELKSVGEWNA